MNKTAISSMRFSVDNKNGDTDTIELSLENWYDTGRVILMGRRGESRIKETIMEFQDGVFLRHRLFNDGLEDNLKLLKLDEQNKIIEITDV